MNMNSQNSGVAYTVIVGGCGMHDVNGVYTRSPSHLSGFPIFYKQGHMGPDFHIVCNDVGPGPNHYMSWSIGMRVRGFPLFLYQSISFKKHHKDLITPILDKIAPGIITPIQTDANISPKPF